MKSKINIIILIAIIFGVTGCSFFTKDNIFKKIEIDEKKCEIIEDIDTHGGFHGDGDYFAKIKCSNIIYYYEIDT